MDAPALVAAPPGPLAPRLEALAAEPDLRVGVAALALGVLPALGVVYATHLGTASAVSEGPVLEVLAGAHRQVVGEIRGGRTLIGRLPDRPDDGSHGHAKFGELFERVFSQTDVFPAVRPS